MPPLPLAQTLPPELLSHIFGWLVEIQPRYLAYTQFSGFFTVDWPVTSKVRELRYASLVCSQWRSPAQEALCRSFDFARVDVVKLAGVLARRPELALAVRAAAFDRSVDKADSFREFETDCENALRVLQSCTNLQHLAIGFVTGDMREPLIDVLDALPLKTLVVSESGCWTKLHLERLTRLSPPEMCSIAQKPTLQYCHLDLGQRLVRYRSTFAPIPSLRASLSTLSLDVRTPTCLARLLAMCSETLLHLDLYFVDMRPDVHFYTSLGLLVHLEELRIGRTGQVEREIDPLSATLPRLVNLKKLMVSDTFASPTSFILALPEGLKIVVFEVYKDLPIAVNDLRRCLEETKSRIPCRALEVLRSNYGDDEDEPWGDRLDPQEALVIPPLAAVCARRGILFRYPRSSTAITFRKTRISFL
ncbi:hypothetical protein NBRC10513_005503 [Rhodotorula toruloides]|uniref:Uncharacterized protein n=1 Tax=Rhodotorula toruloides TaxID=5286 RepID=A0A2S9ZX91_RHOTO|nr:hypothetical protein AAT19DRAFT_11119 [Rhodotorula toruloides]